MGLDEAQHRLEQRFDALKATRAASGYPIYAIEHGLSDEERRGLARELNQSLLLNRGPNRSHWLVWIAAAAEVGYGYDGEEYWRSFSAAFPAWRVFETRETIRSWYSRFVRDYAGVQPSGDWARHFAIIAFPITHAIVPRYLQRLFVQHLNTLRFELAAHGNVGIPEIGAILRDRYSGGFRRFAQFLEQTELTGRLVLALRDEDVGEITPRLSPDALSRIVKDIEALPQGSAMLTRVRRVLRDARVAVSTDLRARAVPTAPALGSAAQRNARLLARRDEVGAWNLSVVVPNFERQLAAKGVGALLEGARVRFIDAAGWEPGAAIYTYARGFERRLRQLPGMSPLLTLREPHPDLADILSVATALSSLPPWLFRCEDDVARQVQGKHVRPGESYLLVAAAVSPDAITALKMTCCPIPVDGVSLFAFTLPEALGGPHFQALRKLGLGHIVQVRVSTVGLTPRWESATESSTWLNTEEVILRLNADHAVSEFVVDVDGKKTRIPALSNTALVSFGSLDIGEHTVSIGAISSTPGLEVSAEEFTLSVRAAEAWTPASPSRAGLRLLTAPVGASIDDVIEGRAELEVRGPLARTAAIGVELLSNSGSSLKKTDLYRAKLPFEPQKVRGALRRLEAPEWAEILASAARVEISATMDELGACSLSFPHAVEPIRWKLEEGGGKWRARLIDEAGAGDALKVLVYSMRSPMKAECPSVAAALEGLEIEPPGALFVARAADATIATVMAPGGVVDFRNILPTCAFEASDSETSDLLQLLHRLRQWMGAGLKGYLASVRRAKVREALRAEMAASACGRAWGDRWAKGMRGDPDVFAELRAELKGSPGYGSAMQWTAWNWLNRADYVIGEFTRVSGVYGVETNAAACADAVTLAFEPEALRLGEENEASPRTERLTKNRRLVRGAFLAALRQELGERLDSSDGN